MNNECICDATSPSRARRNRVVVVVVVQFHLLYASRGQFNSKLLILLVFHSINNLFISRYVREGFRVFMTDRPAGHETAASSDCLRVYTTVSIYSRVYGLRGRINIYIHIHSIYIYIY